MCVFPPELNVRLCLSQLPSYRLAPYERVILLYNTGTFLVPRWASTEVTELVAHPARVACVSIRSNEVITDRLALDYNPLL